MQTNIWNVVFLVIVGPIFEEWLFRKQLIDHTRKYGEKTAILLSGLAFGLFHMNLFQFFYAFLLGLMFGYVYTRTSKLRYSTAMHMIINFNGGVLAPWVLTRVDLDSWRRCPRPRKTAMRRRWNSGHRRMSKDWRSCLSISCCTAL